MLPDISTRKTTRRPVSAMPAKRFSTAARIRWAWSCSERFCALERGDSAVGLGRFSAAGVDLRCKRARVSSRSCMFLPAPARSRFRESARALALAAHYGGVIPIPQRMQVLSQAGKRVGLLGPGFGVAEPFGQRVGIAGGGLNECFLVPDEGGQRIDPLPGRRRLPRSRLPVRESSWRDVPPSRLSAFAGACSAASSSSARSRAASGCFLASLRVRVSTTSRERASSSVRAWANSTPVRPAASARSLAALRLRSQRRITHPSAAEHVHHGQIEDRRDAVPRRHTSKSKELLTLFWLQRSRRCRHRARNHRVDVLIGLFAAEKNARPHRAPRAAASAAKGITGMRSPASS